MSWVQTSNSAANWAADDDLTTEDGAELLLETGPVTERLQIETLSQAWVAASASGAVWV